MRKYLINIVESSTPQRFISILQSKVRNHKALLKTIFEQSFTSHVRFPRMPPMKRMQCVDVTGEYCIPISWFSACDESNLQICSFPFVVLGRVDAAKVQDSG